MRHCVSLKGAGRQNDLSGNLKGLWHKVFGFFHEPVSSWPLGPFQIFTNIRGDIRKFVFIAGVVDNSDKLLPGVNDTGNILSPTLLLQAINYSSVCDTGY